MKYRIGIDVGGTFTDAVIINDETFDIVATEKIPTTHHSENGVADGIIQVLTRAMEKNNIQPEDITFIAHGTTQATNALLEGDVVRVGVLGMGKGLEGVKTKADTNMGIMPLTETKKLPTSSVYVELSGDDVTREELENAVNELKEKESCKAIVAAEAFSVDRPDNERAVIEYCADEGIPGTATSDISKLYGLKVRTRTAVVNASIMPKMLDAANMTEDCIRKAGITNPLMIMRCDGGVMTVSEMRKRPILTILSGPAAGVAGALMYERLTDGLFLEVGGTSTDISCVKDGKVMVKYAQVGGHMTYLTSLDVRTVGIGGGSMVQLADGKAVDIGPRSVHIAGMAYEVYSDPADIVDPVLKTVNPVADDPDYAYVECSNGKKFALSMAGAANIAGYVNPEDYAYGNIEAARKAWQPLADNMGLSLEECAKKVMGYAAVKNGEVVKQLMADYHVDPNHAVFVGGGGGAAAVVPHLAESMGCKHKIAKNGAVISTIGVALAMVRDIVERSVIDPTEEDILAVRREAEQQAIKNGAAPETVEVEVEVDRSRNLVRAIAIGATEMRSKTLKKEKLGEKELAAICAEDLEIPADQVFPVTNNGQMYVMQSQSVTKKFLGLIKKKTTPLRLIDDEGVIRLKRKNANVYEAGKDDWQESLHKIVVNNTIVDDGGSRIPYIFVVYGKRIINLGGLEGVEQVLSMAGIELAGMDVSEKLMIICTHELS
ncbi:MAG: hydantoinase/oxoprolinase family protein [Lachnospiraceae bacterium]|nr:hydantoinase/oxoprolinase family protein [Lachnospiraceae bacterium]